MAPATRRPCALRWARASAIPEAARSRSNSANDASTFSISLSSAAAPSPGAPHHIQRDSVLLKLFEQGGEVPQIPR
jgi:hypothetical protein